MVSMDTGIDAKEAFRLYPRRLVIEAAHNVINNNNQIKAVKRAFDRLYLVGQAA